MIPAKVFDPQLRVTLYKTIRRTASAQGVPVSERFTGMASKIDLTPFFGEGSTVRTTKSKGDAAGAFSLFMADMPHESYLGTESLYGLIEPMDMVEICFTRDPVFNGGKPPVVMRGFVSRVGRPEGAGQDGRPTRGVEVEGQDYGKLWQMLQILFLPGYVVGQDTISGFRLFERYGVGFQTTMKPGDFVREAIAKIVNPYMDRFMPASTPMPRQLQLDVSVRHGVTNVSGPQNAEGTIYDLLRRYNDVGIWNELFIEDRQDGVFVVFRPNPFKTAAGAKIQADSPDVAVTEVAMDSVQTMKVDRSDDNVANYFWVRSPTFDLVSDISRKQMAAVSASNTMLLGDYQNSSEHLYGVRAMFVDTQTGGDSITSFSSGLPEVEHQKRDVSQAGWLDDRRALLVEQNKDNVVFERGSMRLRGNEKIRAGTYLRLRRGQLRPEYYVSSVTHEYVPYQGFLTSVAVERGTGFIERAKLGGGSSSPYFAETP